MHFALLLLLSISASMATKCYIGVGAGDNNAGVYGTFPCGDIGDAYCYKLDLYMAGVHTVTKSCGYSDLCSSKGCHSTTGGTECCCKGDLCNSAAGSSFLAAALAAGAAVWLRQ